MLYIIMHNSCEDGQTLIHWAESKNIPVCRVRLYAGDKLPVLCAKDRVALMGGWMSVGDIAEYPWLVAEKEWLSRVLEAEIPVLGICLGAQLLTEVLGGDVVRGGAPEIGFIRIVQDPSQTDDTLLRGLPEEFMAFQWHNDECRLPAGMRPLASSASCGCQAFRAGERSLGIQFHLDYYEEKIRYNLANFYPAVPAEKGTIQPYAEIIDNIRFIDRTGEYLRTVLEEIWLD